MAASESVATPFDLPQRQAVIFAQDQGKETAVEKARPNKAVLLSSCRMQISA
jgi:hypothetical protein